LYPILSGEAAAIPVVLTPHVGCTDSIPCTKKLGRSKPPRDFTPPDLYGRHEPILNGTVFRQVEKSEHPLQFAQKKPALHCSTIEERRILKRDFPRFSNNARHRKNFSFAVKDRSISESKFAVSRREIASA
jgi:hypothetical protein